MNWTSSFLVQSDKLAIVLHLLLAPVGTVWKPAGHEFVRQSPTPGTSRCFPLSHRLMLLVEGQESDTKILEFSEVTVSGEVPVIPVFSNPVGVITCERW